MFTQAKREAFYREFPFLTKGGDKAIVPPSERDVAEIRISRISKEILGLKPDGEVRWQANHEQEWSADIVLLLDAEGRILGAVSPESDSNSGEKVGDAVIRHPDVQFIVRRLDGFREVDCNRRDWFSIVIYKPPKDWTLRGWVEEQLRREALRLEAEIRTIDEEGGR